MARLLQDGVIDCLFGVPFDSPLLLYTFQLVNFFIRGLEHAPYTGGTDHALETNGIQGIQQALGHMCLSFETTEAPGAMIVAPPSPGRASVFSMCFFEEVPDYDLPMDLRDDTYEATLSDTCIDEMDMIDIGRILDATPLEPHYAFDMFGVSAIDFEDVKLYDTYTNAMDMIGTGRILDVAPLRPR